MKKQGFTLIELLAVIVILAVIALITMPLIMDTINTAKEGAFEESVRGAVAAAGMDAAREKFKYDTYTVKNGGLYRGDEKVDMKGSIPGEGTIQIRKKEGVQISIQNGDICAYQSFGEKSIKFEKRACPK